jgi:hypothetical protein
MPVAAIQGRGSPVTPQLSERGGAHRRHPAEPAREIAELRAEIEHDGRQCDARHVGDAERPAELFDHATERDRLRLHQVPGHGIGDPGSGIVAGEPGNRRRNIFDRHRLERGCGFHLGKIDRKRRQRAQHRAAAIGRRRDHKPRPQDRMRDAGGRDQSLGFAFCRTEGGAVVIGGAGYRDVHQPDRAAAIADRLQQPRDEIAMHGTGIAAGSVLQHAEAIDDEIDAVLPDQPRQRRCIHRHDRQFQIERACLLRGRKPPRDPDHMKAPRPQIVGDEAPDQAGRPEHENFARFAHRTPKPAWRSSARE